MGFRLPAADDHSRSDLGSMYDLPEVFAVLARLPVSMIVQSWSLLALGRKSDSANARTHSHAPLRAPAETDSCGCSTSRHSQHGLPCFVSYQRLLSVTKGVLA